MMEIDSENNARNESPAEAVIELEAIFRALPDLLFYMDSSGRILRYKAGKLSSLYLPPEQFLGRPMQAVLPPDVGHKLFQALQAALKTGKVISVNYQLEVPDGHRWFEASLVKTAESRVIAIVRDVTERVTAAEQGQLQLQRLSALHSIDAAIASSFDLKVTLSAILRQITGQLGVDAAEILLLNQQTGMLEFAAAHGFRTLNRQHIAMVVGQGYAGTAALDRRTVSVPILDEQQAGFLFLQGLAREKFASYYAIPLIAKNQVEGVLEIYHRSILRPTEDWFEFLATLAGQMALAIDNASLVHELQQTNIELSSAYDATIQGWSQALELRDAETEGHTRRVTDLIVRLIQAMGVEEVKIEHARRGAILHDIGKIAIPDSILLKPGPLDEHEWSVMRQHPQHAYDLLSPIPYLHPALPIPYCHHEKWDGSGYPRGLKGEEIPMVARIFSILDVYDALTSNRPYRQAWKREKALEYIQEQSGKYFDPRVVKAFMALIAGEK
ncbi:MAG: HD domain-containing phosphohydrolase [Anaerolineales bacterium]